MVEQRERETEMEGGERASSKAHALVLPLPAQGHINPILQFSKRLASKGLKVTFLSTISIPKEQTHHTSPISIEPIFDASSETIECTDNFMEMVKTRVSKSLDELIEKQKASNFPPKVVVYDSQLTWALDIAHKHGLYGAAFFTQSCAVSAIYYHVHEGSLKVHLEDDALLLPSMPPLGIYDVSSFVYDPGADPSFLSAVLDQFSNFKRADWCLQNTFNELEEGVIQWMASQRPFKTIGPSIPSMYLDQRLENDKDYGLNLFKPKVDECIKWLDTKGNGSVVYVSFGSLANLEQEHMEELALGLKRSQCNFLWVVRESEHNKLPSNFIEDIMEKGLIVTWCPQLDVLAHKATGCFVTHCGWNSTLEALSLGVPLVAMPQWTDQMTNAKFIADVWQIGVRVKVDENGVVKKEEIERCIREVIEGERGAEIKRNATRWKDLAKKAVDRNGSSDKDTEDFVAELVSN